MDPQVFLKVVGCHSVPAGRHSVTLLAYVHFVRAFQVNFPERLNRKCQLRDLTGDWSPMQCHQKCRATQGASYGLGGPDGKGTTCDVGLSSLGATIVVAVGEQWALFGVCSKGVGACCLSTLREGTLEEGVVDSSVL